MYFSLMCLSEHILSNELAFVPFYNQDKTLWKAKGDNIDFLFLVRSYEKDLRTIEKMKGNEKKEETETYVSSYSKGGLPH